MADDPDVPSLLDLDMDELDTASFKKPSQPQPRLDSRHSMRSPPPRGGFPPSGMGAPGGLGGLGALGNLSGLSGMGGGQSMQQIQQMLGNMSPQQMQELMQGFQSIAKSGLIPESYVNQALDSPMIQQMMNKPGSVEGNSYETPLINYPEEEDVDPLILAAKRGDLGKVKEILENGEVNVNVQDKEGNSALHWAALHKDSKSHLEILKLLLQTREEIEVNIENKEENQTPLEWSIIGKNIPALKLLIDHGANIHHTDKRQYNPLILATQHNLPIVCYYLIHLGVSVHSADSMGMTAVHWAAYLSHEGQIRMYSKLGASLNKQDRSGKTPLHIAAGKGNQSALQTLMAEGADGKITDNDGETAADIALHAGFSSLAAQIEPLAKFNVLYRSASGRKKQKYFWFFAGGMYFLAFAALMVNFPMWFSLFCFALLFSACMVAIGDYFPSNERPNKFWMGTFVFGYWFNVLVYFAYVSDWHWSNYPNETLLFYICNFIGGIVYMYTANTDPGIIKPNSTNNFDWIIKRLERGEKIPDICPTCLIAKPLRAKHCRGCNHCVAKFDHHCHWMDACIGVKTHKFFVFFLLFAFFGHCFWMKIVVYYVTSLPTSGVTSLWPLWPNVPLMFYASPVVFFTGLANIVQVLWETLTIYRTYQGIRENLTFNEMQNGEKYHYLKGPGGINYNPFHKSTFADNFMDWWSPKIDYFSLYFINRDVVYA